MAQKHAVALKKKGKKVPPMDEEMPGKPMRKRMRGGKQKKGCAEKGY